MSSQRSHQQIQGYVCVQNGDESLHEVEQMGWRCESTQPAREPSLKSNFMKAMLAKCTANIRRTACGVEASSDLQGHALQGRAIEAGAA